MYDTETQVEIDKILQAADRRGLTKGAAALRRARESEQQLLALANRIKNPNGRGPNGGKAIPAEPAQPEGAGSTPKLPQVPAQRLSSPEGAQATPRASAGPGKPPPPSGKTSCGHTDPQRGPCLREPHEAQAGEKTRHRYASQKVETRRAPVLSSVPQFSDAPKRQGARARDTDGHALIEGSNVVWAGPNGDSTFARGWTGKIIEIDDETGRVLVYGQGPARGARASEAMADPQHLRWVRAADAVKAG